MRRLSRIFKSDGKTVVVAMDHGMGLSVNPALDNTGEVLKAIVRGGADAVLTSYGIARRYHKELEGVGLILRTDGGGSMLGKGSENNRMLFSVEDALRLGADSVACMGFPGAPYEYDSINNLAHLAAEGHAWGMPVMVEALPGGFAPEPANTVDNVRLAVRYSCEAGADIIKTTYTGSEDEFKTVAAASFRPVIVLGGEKVKDMRSLFDCLESAIRAGAAGVAIGRNVWKHPEPEKVVRALVDLVHNGKSAAALVSGL
ncbi:MAG: fructose-bisphosphate aldolase [Treponema sp.]|jgi:class I fructose-bisphosphate aldolase|nr:fructose-bisphosphate aldolase [Treponema sp.]